LMDVNQKAEAAHHKHIFILVGKQRCFGNFHMKTEKTAFIGG
jgi:hypothetical protein